MDNGRARGCGCVLALLFSIPMVVYYVTAYGFWDTVGALAVVLVIFILAAGCMPLSKL